MEVALVYAVAVQHRADRAVHFRRRLPCHSSRRLAEQPALDAVTRTG